MSNLKKLFAFLALSFVMLQASAQPDTAAAPYKRFPGVAPFQILLGDSTTMYSKAKLPAKKQVMLLVFSPDCSHCQHETEEIVARRNQLKNVQIVMITLHPIWMMNDFVNKYHLKALPNVVVGKDIQYFTPTFFGIHSLPFVALYDKKGNLIQAAEGMSVARAIALLKAHS